MNARTVFAAAGSVVTAFAVIDLVRFTRREAEKREELEKNTKLDLVAINRAAVVLSKKIENGQIGSLAHLSEQFNNEIAFQKIAVREN